MTSNGNKLTPLLRFGNTKLSTGVNGDTIATFNIESATDCSSDKLGLCKLSAICYAKKLEARWKNVTKLIQRQQEYWDSVTALEFAVDFLNIYIKKNQKIRALRFNVSGDLRGLDDISKLANIAINIPVPIYLYTKRRDLIDIIKEEYSSLLEISNLVINGSEFMVHNKFKVVKDFSKVELDEKHVVCIADCSICNICMRKNNYTIYVKKH